MAKVVVAMSGGVDSAVAAALLKEAGYEVTGIMMKTWQGVTPQDKFWPRCSRPEKEKDLADAQEVAKLLKIPFHIFDLSEVYQKEVLTYFCEEYAAGRTPNPCVRCNRKVKLGALLEKISEAGHSFDYVATGHYARIAFNPESSRYLLKKARDSRKDQSYFLYLLSQAQLSRLLFPLGKYTKEEVREVARRLKLKVKDKPESQDFTAGGYFSPSLFKSRPGLIVDTTGKVRGEHPGIAYYTIGQRRGLGIAAREPLYVVALDPKQNLVVVGKEKELYQSELLATDLNWIALEKLKTPLKVEAKIRYAHPGAEAEVSPWEKGSVRVRFAKPQRAITPGQAVVFYMEDTVVGGGTISQLPSFKGSF